jgi:RNA polymerase sigma-70 factor, ECF subfamily
MSATSSSESALAARIAVGDAAAFETLMRRYNARLFRVARSILRDDAEAEDALQEAYLDAFRRIETFRGDAQLATWLTRIVINQALMRLRRQKRDRIVIPFHGGEQPRDADPSATLADERAEPPATSALRSELRRILEHRIDELPVAFRTVFVMREVEELTVHETAECLGIPEATVRTRLFRARALLRESLARDLDGATIDVFGFAGERCDRIVGRVLHAASAARPESLSPEPEP